MYKSYQDVRITRVAITFRFVSSTLVLLHMKLFLPINTYIVCQEKRH